MLLYVALNKRSSITLPLTHRLVLAVLFFRRPVFSEKEKIQNNADAQYEEETFST